MIENQNEDLGYLYAAATSEYAQQAFRYFHVGLYPLVVKRLLDVIFALVGLILAFPIAMVVAIAIRIDSPGPIIFTQVRVGKNGTLFRLYKFRSMIHNAESKTGPVWAQKNDFRVTRVGRFIRKTRLDELPQLLNVLKGEMSLVGPRPERPIFVEQFSREIREFPLRLAVKPGLTGLAQIRGGYEHTPKQKLKYDLLYIKNLSLSLDVSILVKTIQVVLFGHGAR